MKNKIICLDFLSVSVELAHDLKLIEGQKTLKFNQTTLELTERRTTNFSQIFDIYVNSYRVGELRYKTNKCQMNERTGIIKFTNELLYTGNLSGIYKRLKYDLKYKFNKINHIDIAIDQSATDDKHIKFAYDYARGKIDFVGNQIIRLDFQKQKIRNVYIGSRSSGKFMRCYYKKQELQVSNKNYIREFWTKNDLDQTNEVFRTELSLSGSLLNKIYAPDLIEDNNSVYYAFLEEKTMDIIQDPKFLNDVFQSETQKFTKCVKVSELNKVKRTNLCKQFTIFAHLKFDDIIIYLKRAKMDAAKMVHKIKMTAKFLHQLYVETDNYFFKAIGAEIADFEDLSEWRASKLENWESEHRAKSENPIYKNYMSAFCNMNFKIIPNAAL